MLQRKAKVEEMLKSLQTHLEKHQAELCTIPSQQAFLLSTFEMHFATLATTVSTCEEAMCRRISEEYTRRRSMLHEQLAAVTGALSRREQLMSEVKAVARDEGNLQVKPCCSCLCKCIYGDINLYLWLCI